MCAAMDKRDTRMAIVMCHPVIPDHRDEAAQKRLVWLRRFIPNTQIHHWCKPQLGMLDSWNQAMLEVANAPDYIEECLFIHDDVIPDDRSELIWERDEDVVCCRFEADAPWLWNSRKAFHNAMFRVKRKVIEVVPGPWWVWQKHWDEAADNIVGCICNYFSRKAQSYLYTVANTGECQHLNLGKWGKIPKLSTRQSPPSKISKNIWDRQMKHFRKQKADRLKEIRNGK